MEIAVCARHLELSEPVRQRATEKVGRLAKYLHGMERAQILFADGKKGHRAEPITCELTLEARGRTVRVVGAGPKPETAFEAAFDKAEHRLTKVKTRLVGRSRPRHKTAAAQAAPGSGTAPEIESP